ncbi:hypothetical protein ACWDBD_17365 [Streptomyces sp. NPDC001118]
MRIVSISQDHKVTIELDANEVRDIRNDLDDATWDQLTKASRSLYHHLDVLVPPRDTRP